MFNRIFSITMNLKIPELVSQVIIVECQYVYSEDEITVYVCMILKIKRRMHKTKELQSCTGNSLNFGCWNNPILQPPLFVDMQKSILKLHQVSSQRCVYLGHRVSVSWICFRCFEKPKIYSHSSGLMVIYHWYKVKIHLNPRNQYQY